MVATPGSGPGGRKAVRVRLSPWAPLLLTLKDRSIINANENDERQPLGFGRAPGSTAARPKDADPQDVCISMKQTVLSLVRLSCELFPQGEG